MKSPVSAPKLPGSTVGGRWRGLSFAPAGGLQEVGHHLQRELQMPGFHWQEGYGAFTISAGHLAKVSDYVLNQEAHHRGTTFQEEYVTLLRKGLVEYDDRYLW